MFHNSVRQLGTRLDVVGPPALLNFHDKISFPTFQKIRCSIITFISGSIEQHPAGVERGPESLVSRVAVRKVRRNKLKQLDYNKFGFDDKYSYTVFTILYLNLT